MNKTIEAVLLFTIVFAVVFALLSVAVMWTWNFVMPALFNLPTITFWQAFALAVLCDLLFLPKHFNSRRD